MLYFFFCSDDMLKKQVYWKYRKVLPHRKGEGGKNPPQNRKPG